MAEETLKVFASLLSAVSEPKMTVNHAPQMAKD
jgi:hypothetical protein